MTIEPDGGLTDRTGVLHERGRRRMSPRSGCDPDLRDASHPDAGREDGDRLRQQALRLAAGGSVDAATQQRVLRELLEAGATCTPTEVLGALHRHPEAAGDRVLDRVVTRLCALGGDFVVAGDREYPARLQDAWPELGAPVWLFRAGARPPVDRRPAVAVVGTRAPTVDGMRTARAIGDALGRAGVVVVSGLARGIDQAAHLGAIDAGGSTVAVLGTGLGVDYPARSAALRQAIARCGALLTELPPGTGPRPWHFLARNRIISGLASATVVVEGRADSGALQTARLAGGQGRDVWAVPGSINAATSAAPLALLRDGAIPLTSVDELVASVLAVPGPVPGSPRDPDPRLQHLSSEAAQILGLLGAVPATTDALMSASTLPAHLVMAAVAELVDCGAGVTTPHGVVRG